MTPPRVLVTLPPPPEVVAVVEAGPWCLRIACRPPAPRRVWLLALHRRGRLVASARGRFLDAFNRIEPAATADDLDPDDRERGRDLVDEVARTLRGPRVLRWIRKLPPEGYTSIESVTVRRVPR